MKRRYLVALVVSLFHIWRAFIVEYFRRFEVITIVVRGVLRGDQITVESFTIDHNGRRFNVKSIALMEV